eukprot:Gregarina_sp_Poly_1__2192@NODE_1583_length_3789_cov_73_608006_g1045_i0_p1_GENE_NODE_1583_length_3789_cov_73_608006_g1045_i0NODE_1583_length_3789_cov_73_608006_g1045_i0_p1_ORF_typecomplete_len754_score81_28_NODE_1583_length_3789_cov_73_608006_g1045_i014003661
MFVNEDVSSRTESLAISAGVPSGCKSWSKTKPVGRSDSIAAVLHRRIGSSTSARNRDVSFSSAAERTLDTPPNSLDAPKGHPDVVPVSSSETNIMGPPKGSEVSASGSWKGSRKILKNATNRMRDLFWAGVSAGAWGDTTSTHLRASTGNGSLAFVVAETRHAPLPGLAFTVLTESAPAQYTNVSHAQGNLDRVLLACLSRRSLLTKRTRKPPLDPSNLGEDVRRLRHALFSISSVVTSPAPAEHSLVHVGSDFLTEMFQTPTSTSESLGRDTTFNSVCKQDSQVSLSETSHTLSPLRSSVSIDPTRAEAVRYTMAFGFLAVKPAAVELYGLDGCLQKRVNMCVPVTSPSDTNLIAVSDAKASNCIGLGRILVVLTTTFKVFIFRIEGLQLVCHFSLGRFEDAWRQYAICRALRPPPDLDHRATALSCPGGNAHDSGCVFVGTSSGLVHVWSLPSRVFECVLPPPSPLGDSMPVTCIVFHSIEMLLTDAELDVASPFREFAEEAVRLNLAPRHPKRTRQLVWVFYGDGRGTLWEGDGCRNRRRGPQTEDTDAVSLRSADLSGPLPRWFTPIDESLVTTSHQFRLLDLYDWNGPALALEPLCSSFASNVTIVTAITLRASAVLVLLVASQSAPQHALFVLLPFRGLECPVVEVLPLSQLGIRESSHRSCLCIGAELLAHGSTIEAGHRQDSLLLEHSGVLYAINVETGKQPYNPQVPPRVLLSLAGSHLIKTKESFASLTYEKDFDELILGTSS